MDYSLKLSNDQAPLVDKQQGKEIQSTTDARRIKDHPSLLLSLLEESKDGEEQTAEDELQKQERTNRRRLAAWSVAVLLLAWIATTMTRTTTTKTTAATIESGSNSKSDLSSSTTSSGSDRGLFQRALGICPRKTETCTKKTFYADTDGDGYGNSGASASECNAPSGYVEKGGDCNDSNRAINPGATEVCNQIDDNCNGAVDEGLPLINFYLDQDNDGFGSGAAVSRCSAPSNLYVRLNGDCNENNSSIHPNATEACNGIDDDCDGVADNGVAVTYYPDRDGDGFGEAAAFVRACARPTPTEAGATYTYITIGRDCNDGNSSIHPDATEVCDYIDNNCNGLIDEFVQTLFYPDADGDGFGDAFTGILNCTAPPGYLRTGTDCNDHNATIHPNGTEVCDEIDNDCNGVVDDGVQTMYYPDKDGDGFGDRRKGVGACKPIANFILDGTDCNDSNRSINPNASEVCNGIDDDCDDMIDDGVLTVYYADVDGDGFGNASVLQRSCTPIPKMVTSGTDCNDFNNKIYPTATEVCNGIDDNCNSFIDENLLTTFYIDQDADGYGNTSTAVQACTKPGNQYVTKKDDCNDGNAAIHPTAKEVCNGLDDDCDGVADDGVLITYYPDYDGDSFGDSSQPVEACVTPERVNGTSYVPRGNDCDDKNALMNPGKAELCNGYDDNCNGFVDENVLEIFYADKDGDGYGNSSDSVWNCSAPSGYVRNTQDCNDNNVNVNPSKTEVCNGLDDDCDGIVDNGVQTRYYLDSDGDGYGNSSVSVLNCTAPVGYVTIALDCDDSNPNIHPNVAEVCNGLDDNCDGKIDEGVLITFYEDVDGDGFGRINSTGLQRCVAPANYALNDRDCNDNNANVKPNATEVCNGIDDNCNKLVDEDVILTFYFDNDTDGFGNSNVTTLACSKPPQYAVVGGDCNDNDPNINGGSPEVCNGLDDDCDGVPDNGVLIAFYLDQDKDTYGDKNSKIEACVAPSNDYVTRGGDCNDGQASINPGAAEICNSIDDDCDGEKDNGVLTIYYLDADGDGYGNPNSTISSCSARPGYVLDGTDCNDANALIRPNATELCNNIDDDCDGIIDEDAQLFFYADRDGDGYGDFNNSTQACSAPPGFVIDQTDCDDTRRSVHPNATEVCNLIDDDCDGNIDEGVKTIFYLDNDGDGFGTTGNSTEACTAPAHYVLLATDCNDTDASIHPGASEVCNYIDDNCNGVKDENVTLTFYRDVDNDGYGSSTNRAEDCFVPPNFTTDSSDCDDANPLINPGMAELCNQIDDNCNGAVDEGLVKTYYKDEDGDGFGNSTTGTTTCLPASGSVLNGGDCNDYDAKINPNQTEICNGIDDNCNGVKDEGVLTTYYPDVDRDGYGDGTKGLDFCTKPENYTLDKTDCNDRNASINPAAVEICNGIDDDCDNTVDNGLKFYFMYEDVDGDTYGNSRSSVYVCKEQTGHVNNSLDCNDTNAAINPSITEICNGIDDDCDGTIDDGVLLQFYLDNDGDGYGDGARPRQSCEKLSGYVTDSTDCNDANRFINPSMAEICNGIDDDCDYIIDDNLTFFTLYLDADNDGFGRPGTSIYVCDNRTGYVFDNRDCNDTNAMINPNATEVCNRIDDDCDGSIDEDVQTTYFADNDGDGYGNPGNLTAACSAPNGYVENDDDCNDTSASIRPGAVEVCNNIDDDCNRLIDDGLNFIDYYPDKDGDGDGGSASVTACKKPDGYVLNTRDCNDSDATIYFGAKEVCNGIDDNCNGLIDEGLTKAFYLDADNDNYGNSNVKRIECTAPAGYVDNDRDCNDSNSAINPGATEVCNGIDDNCDFTIDNNLPTAEYYEDIDGDGYGKSGVSSISCAQPAGYVLLKDDCDDTRASVNPGANEICENGIDDDCDAWIDEDGCTSENNPKYLRLRQ